VCYVHKQSCYLVSYTITLRCLINIPHLFIFLVFSSPPDLIRTPHLSFLRNMKFFYELFTIFPFFVSIIQVQFQGKIVHFCMYFSFRLYDNLFLLLHNHCKAFLKFQFPHLLTFKVFLTPPIY